MSIQEVELDWYDRIKNQTCIDPRIATAKMHIGHFAYDKESGSQQPVAEFPVLRSTEELFDEEETEGHPVVRETVITAKTEDQVVLEDVILGSDSNGEPTRIQIRSEVFNARSITPKNTRIGDRAFVWTPTPDFRIPQPSRRHVLKKMTEHMLDFIAGR